jgi:hypothetical protein
VTARLQECAHGVAQSQIVFDEEQPHESLSLRFSFASGRPAELRSVCSFNRMK